MHTALLILFLFLQLADAVTSYIGIKRDVAEELNPIANGFFRLFGLFGGLLVMKGIVFGVAFFADPPILILAILSAFFAVVVINNLIVIRHKPQGTLA